MEVETEKPQRFILIIREVKALLLSMLSRLGSTAEDAMSASWPT